VTGLRQFCDMSAENRWTRTLTGSAYTSWRRRVTVQLLGTTGIHQLIETGLRWSQVRQLRVFAIRRTGLWIGRAAKNSTTFARNPSVANVTFAHYSVCWFFHFYARQVAYVYSITREINHRNSVCLSICLSVRHMGGSVKMVQARIIKSLLSASRKIR